MSTTEERPLDEIIAEGAPAEQAEQAPSQAQQTIDTSPQPEPQGNWTYAALKDERGKRQRAQERIAELEQQLAVHEPQESPADQFWTNPEVHIGRMEMAARGATLRASRAEIVAEHGRGVLNEIEDGVRQAMEANHPDIPLLREAMLASDHPVEVAAMWVAQQQRGQHRGQHRGQQRMSAPVYPSNLASTRSVGSRRGPAWSGPASLDSIFETGRPK